MKRVILLMFVLIIKINVIQAQVELSVNTESQKFFGSANSSFQWGGGGAIGMGWRNLFYLQGEYATYLPNQFDMTETVSARNFAVQPNTQEINSKARASVNSYGVSCKFVWAQPSVKKRNQFYIMAGATYLLYHYQINERGQYDNSVYQPVLLQKDTFKAWMIHVGIGYEWLVNKNIGVFIEMKGMYPITRRSYTYFEDIEIPSLVRVGLGMRLRILKGIAEI